MLEGTKRMMTCSFFNPLKLKSLAVDAVLPYKESDQPRDIQFPEGALDSLFPNTRS